MTHDDTRLAIRALAEDAGNVGAALLLSAALLCEHAAPQHWADVFRHGALLERAGHRAASARFLMSTCSVATAGDTESSTWLTALLRRVSGRSDAAAIDFGHGEPRPGVSLPPGWVPGAAMGAVGSSSSTASPLPQLEETLVGVHAALYNGQSLLARDTLARLPPAAKDLPYAQVLLASALYSTGDTPRLFAHAQRLVSERPGDAVALLAAGLHAMLVGRTDDARRLFLRAVRSPGSPIADCPLTSAIGSAAAEAHAKHAAAIRALVSVALGNCHAAVGDHDQALASYVAALDHVPGRAPVEKSPAALSASEARACIAAEHVRVGRPVLARAYVCDTDDLRTLNERGAAHFASGEYAQALGVYERATALLDDTTRHTCVGRALMANLAVARLRHSIAERDAAALSAQAAAYRDVCHHARLAALLAEIDGVANGNVGSLSSAILCLKEASADALPMRASALSHRALRRILARMYPLPADHPLNA